MTTKDIERIVANHFGWRTHIIVPNVSWGVGIHECDLLILTKGGYATEVEIKISLSDLKKDSLKDHHHSSEKIKRLYFAIPSKMEKHIRFIPENAGIILCWADGCKIIREAQINHLARTFSIEEMMHTAHLGCMRIWTSRFDQYKELDQDHDKSEQEEA